MVGRSARLEPPDRSLSRHRGGNRESRARSVRLLGVASVSDAWFAQLPLNLIRDPVYRSVSGRARLLLLTMLAERPDWVAVLALRSGAFAGGVGCSRSEVEDDLRALESAGLVVVDWEQEFVLLVPLLVAGPPTTPVRIGCGWRCNGSRTRWWARSPTLLLCCYLPRWKGLACPSEGHREGMRNLRLSLSLSL